eukprot:6212898-Pleurochrysis_carterae.AAC.7
MAASDEGTLNRVEAACRQRRQWATHACAQSHACVMRRVRGPASSSSSADWAMRRCSISRLSFASDVCVGCGDGGGRGRQCADRAGTAFDFSHGEVHTRWSEANGVADGDYGDNGARRDALVSTRWTS